MRSSTSGGDMLIEIATFRGKPASGCVTTSVGRIWYPNKYYNDYIKNGALQLDVPDEEARAIIKKELCRRVEVEEPHKPRRKTAAVPTVVDEQLPPGPMD